jgi:hypothetical protein
MRKLLALVVGGSAVTALLIACSDSPKAEEGGEEGSSSSSSSSGLSSSSGASGSSSSSGGSSSSSSSGSSGDTDGGSSGDGGSTSSGGTSSGGTGDGGGGAGSLCNAQTQKEIEANDSQGTATAVTTGFCGVLPTGTDVDFATFTLPANATNFNFNTQVTKPQVDFFLIVGAQRVPIQGGSLPFEPGQKYYIEVRNKQNTSVDYRVLVNIKI